MMSVLTDDEWKTVRTLSTPTFTSGKLKSVKLIKIRKYRSDV